MSPDIVVEKPAALNAPARLPHALAASPVQFAERRRLLRDQRIANNVPVRRPPRAGKTKQQPVFAERAHGRSTPAHHVFERQAVAADLSEALTSREHGDKLAAFLKSGRVQRSDYARPENENFHGMPRAVSDILRVLDPGKRVY